MMQSEEVFRRAKTVIEKVAETAHKTGRNLAEIQLIAVSKKKPAEFIEAAFEAGIRNFGENYPQELADKTDKLRHLQQIRWHMIGHLQRNKIKFIENKIVCLHSLDSIELAQKIDSRLQNKNLPNLPVLIMINIGNEPTKHGIPPTIETIIEFAQHIITFQKLELKGFMCLPPFTENLEDVRPYFRQLRTIRDRVQDEIGKELKELSMGMSHDFTVAIEEGSTMVRIGTSIFGARD